MNHPAIVSTFVILGVILLWIIIFVRGKWWLKIPLISATLLTVYGLTDAIDSYMGYPVVTDVDGLPHKFQYLAVIIDEPNRLLLWIVPISEEEISKNPLAYKEKNPRAYQIPYTRGRHQQGQNIKGLLREGKIVLGGEDVEGGSGRSNGNGQGGDLYFGELAPSFFMPKD